MRKRIKLTTSGREVSIKALGLEEYSEFLNLYRNQSNDSILYTIQNGASDLDIATLHAAEADEIFTRIALETIGHEFCLNHEWVTEEVKDKKIIKSIKVEKHFFKIDESDFSVNKGADLITDYQKEYEVTVGETKYLIQPSLFMQQLDFSKKYPTTKPDMFLRLKLANAKYLGEDGTWVNLQYSGSNAVSPSVAMALMREILKHEPTFVFHVQITNPSNPSEKATISPMSRPDFFIALL